MTDSGSFDSGDTCFLADLDALLALVDAKCSTAGVTGSGLAAGWFTTNRIVNSASTWQAIVAAYQRAWDASSNKPGTRQSQPSAGGNFYGSLFQNMWTQLNSMTFVKSWENWDEGSQSTLLTDASRFAVFFDGAYGTDEVGAGWGLTGTGATFTDYADNVGAYNSTYGGRYTQASAYFLFPSTWLDSLHGYSTWSIIAKWVGADWSASNRGPWHLDRNASPSDRLFIRRDSGGLLTQAALNDSFSSQTLLMNSDSAGYYESYSGSVYFCMWGTTSGVWAGIKTGSKPSSLASMDFSVQLLTSIHSFSASNTAIYTRALGNAYMQGYNLGMPGYLNYLVASRGLSFIS